MTGNDAVSSALRLIRVLAPGEALEAADGSTGLQVLNRMLDSWNAESLCIFTTARQVFSLTPGQQSYTLGTGGNFNVARPAKIVGASIINLNNPSQPFELPLEMLTTAQWQLIPVKNIQSALPLKLYDDGGFPLRTLNYWCIPNTAVDTALYTWTALSSFANGTTSYTFPPGYEKAIIFNLALDLSAEYGKAVDPAIAAQAISAKGIVKSINITPLDMYCDAALVSDRRSVWNYITGDWQKPGG